tara:strand:- start:267 stop:626 length:360 start_codon:yes stop_codon:yes gene_type:complete
MPDELRNKISNLFDSQIGESIIADYRKLISFIDQSVAGAFKMSGDERANFLVTNMLNMRSFLNSEIITETVLAGAKQSVLSVHDDHFKTDEERDLEIKKKESELEEEQPNPENLSATDP